MEGDDKRKRGKTLIEDKDRCLVCTGGADDLRMFTGFARTWGVTYLLSKDFFFV